MKLFGRKKKTDLSEYEQLCEEHTEYRALCKDLLAQFEGWEKRLGALFKDGEKACAVLVKTAALTGVNGSLSVESLGGQDARLQAQVEGGKQLLKEIITENTETRKAIDERDKAEKVMHSKEATAEKAEKKGDEKAPQYRDEAVKATADFKLLDGQVMERLRKWQQTRGETFSRAYQAISGALQAPSLGGSSAAPTITVAPSAARAVSPVKNDVPTASRGSTVARVVVPADLSGVSESDLKSLQTKVNEALAKATRNRDELEKLAAMYGTKDKEAASKAQQEAVLMEAEISSLQGDLERIVVALGNDAVGGSPPPSKLPPGPSTMSPSGGGSSDEQRAKVLYDFTAERPEELSLTAGDEVVVLDSSETEGWWEGMTADGKTGFFPGSYVQLQ